MKQRFLPGLINGRDRWCQGFSEPDAGSDLASLRTRAVLDGDEYIDRRPQGLDQLLRPRGLVLPVGTDRSRRSEAQGPVRLRVRMDQPGIEQRPLRMINGITREFGEVTFDDARVPAANMIGEPRRRLEGRHDRARP